MIFQSRGTDGWTPAGETWTYASASTITVPSGAAAKYTVGDRIKWTQTTVKYGTIVTVADTLLTILVNTDYTVANAAITSNYYSHSTTPVGYPSKFAWTPIWTLDGGTLTTTYTTQTGTVSIVGKTVSARFNMKLNVVTTATASSVFLVNYPVAPAISGLATNSIGGANFIDGAVTYYQLQVEPTSSTTMRFWRTDAPATNFFGADPAITLATTDQLVGSLVYEI